MEMCVLPSLIWLVINCSPDCVMLSSHRIKNFKEIIKTSISLSNVNIVGQQEELKECCIFSADVLYLNSKDVFDTSAIHNQFPSF